MLKVFHLKFIQRSSWTSCYFHVEFLWRIFVCTRAWTSLCTNPTFGLSLQPSLPPRIILVGHVVWDVSVIQIAILASKCSFWFEILHFGGFALGADELVSVYKFNACTGCSWTSYMMEIWCRYEFREKFVVNFNGFRFGFCILRPREWFPRLLLVSCFSVKIEGEIACNS